MPYRRRPGLLIDKDTTVRAASRSIGTRFRTWQALDAERRMQAVNEALKAPANDLIDSYPLAL